jgi:hypothetical protein
LALAICGWSRLNCYLHAVERIAGRTRSTRLCWGLGLRSSQVGLGLLFQRLDFMNYGIGVRNYHILGFVNRRSEPAVLWVLVGSCRHRQSHQGSGTQNGSWLPALRGDCKHQAQAGQNSRGEHPTIHASKLLGFWAVHLSVPTNLH